MWIEKFCLSDPMGIQPELHRGTLWGQENSLADLDYRDTFQIACPRKDECILDYPSCRWDGSRAEHPQHARPVAARGSRCPTWP